MGLLVPPPNQQDMVAVEDAISGEAISVSLALLRPDLCFFWIDTARGLTCSICLYTPLLELCFKGSSFLRLGAKGLEPADRSLAPIWRMMETVVACVVVRFIGRDVQGPSLDNP